MYIRRFFFLWVKKGKVYFLYLNLLSRIYHARGLDPENRRLLQIKISDIISADGTFNLFMGDEVEPRREYIQSHAKDVKNLDI